MSGITIKLEGMSALLRNLDDFQQRQVPFVTAYALTKTAQDIREEERRVMAEVFDRPTRFTLNSLFVRPATKANLSAEVYFKEGFGSVPAWRYLGPQVEGGPRRHKSFERALIRAGVMRADEFAVPGAGVNLDQHGNMRGGEITRILSQLNASPDPTQNIGARGPRRRSRRNAGRYFLLRGRGAPDGIYHRGSGREIKPVLIFVRSPQYSKRFPFYETARRVFDQRFAARFREGMARYGQPRPRAA